MLNIDEIDPYKNAEQIMSSCPLKKFYQIEILVANPFCHSSLAACVHNQKFAASKKHENVKYC